MFLLFALLYCCMACKQSPATNESTAANALYALKDKFRYKDLQQFDFTDMKEGYDAYLDKFKKVDSADYKWVFQDEKKVYHSEKPYAYYFHSWQNRDTGFIEFTILSTGDLDSGMGLMYYIYDRNGKFIDKFLVGCATGDGGDSDDMNGRQLNKNEFLLQGLESSLNIDNDSLSISDNDTTAYSITIDAGGKSRKKQLFKRHYTDTVRRNQK